MAGGGGGGGAGGMGGFSRLIVDTLWNVDNQRYVDIHATLTPKRSVYNHDRTVTNHGAVLSVEH